MQAQRGKNQPRLLSPWREGDAQQTFRIPVGGVLLLLLLLLPDAFPPFCMFAATITPILERDRLLVCWHVA